MIIMIDNYDSFTYNLVQYFEELGQKIKVYRNDAITIEQIKKLKPQAIILSPGPCTPDEAGICLDVVKELKNDFPILGVCLGHQSIAQAFGAKIVRAKKIMHGKTSMIQHDGKDVFKGLSQPMQATRYHSLLIKADTLPDCLLKTSWTDEGEIMALRHKKLPIIGIQFHPESILTLEGKQLIKNFIDSYCHA